jgi:chemotaxis protein MotB
LFNSRTRRPVADRPADEEEQEGYLTSVSDLMAGLLFVFILALFAYALQLATSTRDADARLDAIEGRRASLQAELDEMRRRTSVELQALRREVGQGLGEEIRRLDEALEHARQRRSVLLEGLAAALQRRRIPVTIDTVGGVLRLPDNVLFGSGRSDLPAGGPARETLQIVAEVLAQTLPCFAAGAERRPDCGPEASTIIDAVFIEGHTDRRRLGAGELDGNYELSASRALNTYAAIRAARPDLWELRSGQGTSLMGVSGYGPDRPVLGRVTDREEDLAANRRIEIRFLLAAPEAPDLRRLRGRVERLQVGQPP